MMMIAAAGMLALSGCATDGAAPPAQQQPAGTAAETITYHRGPCFGACPVYSVTVTPDGQGTFTGERFTAVTGTRSFTVDRATYDRFAAILAPYRPAQGTVRYQPGSDNCGSAPTDMPSADVKWQGATGTGQVLNFYYGCRSGNGALAAALDAAPDVLPIADFIGRH
ncbi:MAG: DUF6438 domain-containing protein [Sphingomonas sp.]